MTDRNRDRRSLRSAFGKPTVFAVVTLIVTVVVLNVRQFEGQALPEKPRTWLVGLQQMEFCTVGSARTYGGDGGPQVSPNLGHGFIDGYPVIDVRAIADRALVLGSFKKSDTTDFEPSPKFGLRELGDSEDYILISTGGTGSMRWSIDGESGSVGIVGTAELDLLSQELGMDTHVPLPY